jgi:hypothetical protein
MNDVVDFTEVERDNTLRWLTTTSFSLLPTMKNISKFFFVILSYFQNIREEECPHQI